MLCGVIPKPDRAAIERGSDQCKHFDRLDRRIGFEFRHEVAGPRLPIDLVAGFVLGLRLNARGTGLRCESVRFHATP